MARDEKSLERHLLSRFGVVVDELIVEDSFPHIERPSIEDMEEAIETMLDNKPLAMEMAAKLSTKPTWEMLNDFCEKRGLIWERDIESNCYIFRVKKFYEADR